jgi:hypothetical protein
MLGPGLGIGAAYTFSSGWKLFLYPSMRWSQFFADRNRRLVQGGVAVGVGYQF